MAAHENDTSPDQPMSDGEASDSDGSESASDSEQNDPPSSLVADAEQYELMQKAYLAVGQDFKDVIGGDDLIGSKYDTLQQLEKVPERWPLARLSFSLQTCVEHLDRVLAGCCWEVQATRITPSDSLTSLHDVAKCLTMQLAVYLAKKRSLPFSGRFLPMRPKSCTMTALCICCVPIIGYHRSTRNCCIHLPDALLPGSVKENDPVVAWSGLQRI